MCLLNLFSLLQQHPQPNIDICLLTPCLGMVICSSGLEKGKTWMLSSSWCPGASLSCWQ